MMDNDGWTPLYAAAAGGYLKAAHVLIESGASVNLQTKFGDIPLHRAITQNNVEMVIYLLEQGADTSVISHQGKTITELAKDTASSEMQNLLQCTERPQSTKKVTVPDTFEVNVLIANLEDPSWNIRHNAIKSLEKLMNDKAINPILACVGKERNFRVRGAGLIALSEVFLCLDEKMNAKINALWDENGIDTNDHDSGFDT